MLINYVEVQDRRRLSGFHLVFQHWPHMVEGSRVFTGPRRFPFASVGVFVERTSQTTVAQKFMISLLVRAVKVLSNFSSEVIGEKKGFL